MNRVVTFHRQRGLVLASSLLLLVVVTIMALSMFRGFGIQERIASNVREKHRALQAAQAAQQKAEDWLSTNANPNNPGTICTAALLNANLQSLQICDPSTSIDQLTGNPVTTVPWMSGGQEIGATYTPSGTSATMTVGTGQNAYYKAPRLYITDQGSVPNGRIYQVDAVGYGGSADAIAVIESSYFVFAKAANGGAL